MTRWFMVENNIDQKEQLVAARVAFTELEITKPRPLKGIAFPESEKNLVLFHLGLGSTFLTEVETDREGVTLLQLRQHQVVLESNSNMEAWSEIEPVLREFAAVLGVDIYASNPHGNATAPKTEAGKLFLRFWSAPENRSAKLHYAFGRKLSGGQEDAVEATGDGYPIVDPDGITVAEVVGGMLYVLFDLPDEHRNAAELMRLIMEQFALLQKSPEERERVFREMAEREKVRSREAYTKECGRRLQNTIEATRSEAQQAKQAIEEAQRRITEQTRAESGFRKKLEQLLESGKESDARFATEFDRLLAVPGVTKVAVKDGLVQVFTDQIDISYGDRTYDIGKFRIDIRTDGGSGGVRCYNLTCTIESRYYHPHVKSDGSCCLGNIADGVAKLIGSYEFSVLAQLMLQYLRTVNDREWYKSIEYWPKGG